MHGTGNDFVLLDLRGQKFELGAEKASAMANRSTGIGCDQILVLKAASDPSCLLDFEVWNADGSRALQCGNGVRCIGLYLRSRGETDHNTFTIRGPVSIISLQETEPGMFRVNMGPPRFEPENIPINLAATDGNYELTLGGKLFKLGAVSMGNPHALLEVPAIEAADLAGLGAEISRHPAFPNGCNAGFAQVIDRNTIRLRVFERGAGETMACGSGACAAVSILIERGKLNKEVLVNQVGGALIIEWDGGEEPVMMTGSANHLFVGTLI